MARALIAAWRHAAASPGDRTMHRKTLIAAALLAAIATTAAIAAPQAAEEAQHRGHAKLDANNDGAIDRAEAASHPRLAAKFDQLDTNKDGKLNAAERPQWKRGHRGGRGDGHGGMAHMDKDADGRVSRAEFDAGSADRAQRMAAMGKGADARKPMHQPPDFSALDVNRDGYLVRGEVSAYHERMRPQREAEFAKHSAERFAAADINKDGKLSRLEVGEKMPRIEKSFAWMDENRDGFLSQQELQPKPHR
jgi:Ni/Co efflux regulator RcnB